MCRPGAPQDLDRGNNACDGFRKIAQVLQGEIPAQFPGRDAVERDAGITDQLPLHTRRGTDPQDAPAELLRNRNAGEDVSRRSPTGKGDLAAIVVGLRACNTLCHTVISQ